MEGCQRGNILQEEVETSHSEYKLLVLSYFHFVDLAKHSSLATERV